MSQLALPLGDHTRELEPQARFEIVARTHDGYPHPYAAAALGCVAGLTWTRDEARAHVRQLRVELQRSGRHWRQLGQPDHRFGDLRLHIREVIP